MRYSPKHSRKPEKRLRRFSFATAALICLSLAGMSPLLAGSNPDRTRTQVTLRGQFDRPGSTAQDPVVDPTTHPATTPAAKPAPKPPPKPYRPRPVAGLSQVQMDNAYRIVQVGRALHLPKRAFVIAVATAMQESNLLNLASDVLPESKLY